jgi:2-polyprenyl-3-methyl-5-hydroxy-6-metoxy-1,4-benzoquinol methylase
MDDVFHSRAVPTMSVALENDPDVMVHQQLARLRFFESQIGARSCRILEFGCGTGFNCHYLNSQASKVIGFDPSEEAVGIARSRYPDVEFRVEDACSPDLSIEPGTWDRIVAFEVLEHVPDMIAFLSNIRKHLKSEGIAFITTPNRLVFSLGHVPSPMNREHIKELSDRELASLLQGHFARIKLYGQKFTHNKLLEEWKSDVRRKIELLQAGERWKPKRTVASFRRFGLIEQAYQTKWLRKIWTSLRYGIFGAVEARIQISERPYTFSDFEFAEELTDALWICAAVRV